MKNKWRSIAWVLVVALLCGQIPTQVYAKEGQSIQTVSGGDSAVENTGAGMDTISRANTTDVKDSEINWTEEKAEEMDAVYDALVVAANATDNITFAGGDGTEDNPYQIEIAEQLYAICYYPDSYFCLLNDIDLSEYNNGIWPGICSEDNPFTGSFDGQDNTIRNLNLGTINSGLFICTSGSVIKNLNIESESITINYTYDEASDVCSSNVTDYYVSSGYYAGVLVGIDIGSSSVSCIENCHIITDFNIIVNSEKSDRRYSVGGVIGYNSASELQIQNCSYKGDINFYSDAAYYITYHDIGGFLGKGYCKLIGNNVLFEGRVNVAVNPTANETYIGGLVGEIAEIEINSCTIQSDIVGYPSDEYYFIEDCTSRQYVGGLAGKVYNSIDISNTTIIGNLDNDCDYGTGSSGGFFGGASSGTISDSSFIGKISNYAGSDVGKAYAGGLCGQIGSLLVYGCKVDSDIYNCGYYHKKIYTGGIVGYKDYGDVIVNSSNIKVKITPDAYSSANAYAYTGGIIGYASSDKIAFSDIQLHSEINDSSTGLYYVQSGNLIGASYSNITIDGNNTISGNKYYYGWANDSDLQTIIQYGKNSNSFDEEIIGYCGSTIETTLMLKSDKYTIDDLTILSSDNTVVEIGHIEKGMGTYVPADGSEHVAVVHLNLKDIGSSEIMISAPDGTFKSIPVTSKEAVYSIKMYSLIPTLTIGKKTSIGAAVQLDRNGTMVIDDVSFSIVSSNCNVVSISDIRSESDGTFFSLNGVSEGTAVITVTESVSGAVYSTTVYVNSGILTYNAEAMPKYYDGKNECNGYIDGMYIDEFISEPCEDSKLSVSFNVYNTTSKNGAVDVYDAKGKLVDSEMIERFSDNYVTSIKDTFISGYKLLEDCVNEDLLTYKQASCSQKTLVEVEVPVGGHIEITNNSTYSDTCAIYNEVDLSITSVLMLSDVIKLNVEEIKGVSKTATKKLVSGFFETYVDSLKGNTAAEKISELGKKFAQKIGEMGMKQMHESTIKGNMATIIDDGKAILEECDIDLDALILSSVADVGVSLVEDSLKEAMGIPGAVLSSMFKVNEYLNHTSFLIDMCATNGNKALMIYFDDENGCLYDDGVSVKSANGTNELSQDNYVMHSVVLSNNTDLSEQMKEALDKISMQYVVRDIYLLKDDIITQPDQDVQVTVPIPKEYDIYSCKLYWVQEDGSLTEIRTQIVNRNFIFTTNHFSYYAVVETKEMSSISGTVTCFGDGTASTTMRLVDSSGAITAENTIIGNSAEYALENIPLGTYTLQVSKQNHITREYVVTLSDAIVIVTQDTELHLVGDINGDGRINARDKKMLYNHIACLTVLDDYDLAVADVNGDGKVNARDKKIIYNHIAGISLLWE